MSNSRKYKVSFRYSNQCPSQTNDGLSAINSTSRISYATFNSAYSASSNCSKRVNQLLPKTKVNLKSKPKTTQKKIEVSPEKKKERKKQKQEKRKQQHLESLQSMNYNSIKPTIGWKKYTILCGFQRGLGESGCQCSDQCKWKQNWTKNYKQQNFKLYKGIQKEKAKDKYEEQIDKDIPRTHTECPTFTINSQFQQMLREVLVTYSIYDPQVGYAQGMNMIAGVLLYHIKNSQLTFWAFVDLMDDQQLRMVYLEGFEPLKEHCRIINSIIMSKINDLYNHMKQLQIIPDVFLYGWVLSLMSNCIPMEHMHEVIDKFRVHGWTYIYQLIIAYLLYLKEYLMLAEDAAEFLMSVNTKSSRQLGVQWQQMIENCQKIKVLGSL